ncbi:MAG TPA: GGDEF domain-containing protein [Candidatus Limnocylindrales bacterium]|nr:GGDEF domain-containing protein [Candidatus Limnocylindrales bacterium]
MTPPTERHPSRGTEDPRIRRSWLAFAGAFFLLGLIAVFRLWVDPRLSNWAIALLIVVVGFAAVRHRIAVQDLEAGRRAEAESFARILQGLSRSISPDAIVEAIVEELGIGTGADHIVIVRRRPDARVLEATLVNARTGGSTSSTLFPIADLEDPPDLDVGRWGREPVAIPIDIEGDVGLALSGARPRLGGDAVTVTAGAPRRSGRRMPANAPAADFAATIAGTRSSRLRDLDPDRLVANRIATRARAVFGLRHTLVTPLTTDGGMIGALLISRRTAGAWPAAAHRLLVGAAIEASAALSRVYSHRQAEARASTDGLTGLPNRRYFDEFCALLSRRRRAEDSVGVLMIDIDKFKVLNDTYGHPVGDEVLRAVAAAIVGAVREDDVPARYGGEEFAVLLRNPTIEVAVEVGERVRAAVAGLDLARFGVRAVRVSVGAAVAEDPDEPITATIEQADRALYDAKRRGRDRVVAA